MKPFAYDELLARVRALLRRRGAAGDEREPLRLADLVLDPASREVRRGDRAVDLTPLQFDLLAHLVRHPRVVLTRERLLDAVWGLDADGGSNVVDVCVAALRAQLEAGGEPRLVHTVRGVGYVAREPRDGAQG